MCDRSSNFYQKPASRWISIRSFLLVLLGMSAAACGDGKAGMSAAAITGNASAQSSAGRPQTTDTADRPSGRQSSAKGPTRTGTPGKDSKARDIVPQIVIAPGLERLSYLSPKLVGIRPDYRECLSKQGHEEDCAEEEWRFQDARMNTAYQTLLSKAAPAKDGRGPEPVSRASVIAAQRAWLDFMNSNCAAKALRFGSSRAPATQSVCEMQMTAYRAQELEDWSQSVDRSSSSGH